MTARCIAPAKRSISKAGFVVIGGGKEGDVGPLNGAASSVAYMLRDSRGNEILKGNAALNALGGFDAAFKLPPTMNLGDASLELLAQGGTGAGTDRGHGHQIQVQEFRRPEFEVDGAIERRAALRRRQRRRYRDGLVLRGRRVAERRSELAGEFNARLFHAAQSRRFHFRQMDSLVDSRTANGREPGETFRARTDAAGKHRLRMDFVSVDPPRPYTVTAEASVTDVNRQAWTAQRRRCWSIRLTLYVGIRSPRTFVQKGEPLIVQTIVTDLDGKAIAGREIRMRAVLMDWVFEKGEWSQKEVNPQECVSQIRCDAVECKFETKEGGQYQVTATIYDDRERRNESEIDAVGGWRQGDSETRSRTGRRGTDSRPQRVPAGRHG